MEQQINTKGILFRKIKSCDDLLNAIELVSKKRVQSPNHVNESLKRLHIDLIALGNNLLSVDIVLRILSFIFWKRNDCFDLFYANNEQAYFITLQSLRQVSRLFQDYFGRDPFWHYVRVKVDKKVNFLPIPIEKIPIIRRLKLKTEKDIKNNSFYQTDLKELQRLEIHCKLFPTLLHLPNPRYLMELSLENAEISVLPSFENLKILHLKNTFVGKFSLFDFSKLESLSIEITNSQSQISETAKKIVEAASESKIVKFSLASEVLGFGSLLMSVAGCRFLENLKYFSISSNNDVYLLVDIIIYILSFLSVDKVKRLEINLPNLKVPLLILEIVNKFKLEVLSLGMQISDLQEDQKIHFDFSRLKSLCIIGLIPIHSSLFVNSPIANLSLLCESISKDNYLQIITNCSELKSIEIDSNSNYCFHSLVQCIIQHKSIERVKITRKILTIPLVQHLKSHFGDKVCIF